jgi:hypothetical protein
MWRSSCVLVVLPSLFLGPGCSKTALDPTITPTGDMKAESSPDAGRPAYCWLAFGPEAGRRILVTYDGRSLRLGNRATGDGKEDVFSALAECNAVTVSDPDGQTAYIIRGVEDMGFVADLGRGLAIDVEVTGPVPYWQGAQVRLGEVVNEAPVVHFHAPLTLGPYASVKANSDRRLEWRANPQPRLVRGEHASILSVQVQNRESRPGCHVVVASTDMTGQTSRFPKTVRPVAEVEFPSEKPGGEQVRRRYVLDKVCCGSRFYKTVDVPAEAGLGIARVVPVIEAHAAGK